MKAMVIRTLFLSVAFVLATTPVYAEPEILQKQKFGPLLASPGEYFAIVENTKSDPEKNRARSEYLKKQFGSDEAYRQQLEKIASSSSDYNAEAFMRAVDGYLSTSATYSYVMSKSNDPNKDPKIMNKIQLPDGKTVYLHWSTSIALNIWTLVEINKLAEKKIKPVSVAGVYDAEFNGECPVENGEMKIVQDKYNIEGRRGNMLLLWGRIGETEAYMQLAEAKYLEVYGPKERPVYNYPSRPSDVYRSKLGKQQLKFEGIYFKKCTLRLTKRNSN